MNTTKYSHPYYCFQDAACAELGIILYLEIQEGKKLMAPKPFNHELGATAGCTFRLAKAIQYAGETAERAQAESSKKPLIYYGDSWFGSLKFARKLKETLGHESICAIKTSHAGLPKAFVEGLMKDFPSGSNITLKATIEGHNYYFVGYKYNSKRVLLFLCSENAGSLTAGSPYVARFSDSNGNMHSREVQRPEAICKYFKRSNSIDRHNQLRQGFLRLEKSWVTKCCWFRMATTAVGMTLTDAFLLASRSDMPVFKSKTIHEFADMVAWDLMNNKCSDDSTPSYIATLNGSEVPPPVDTISVSTSAEVSTLSGSPSSSCSNYSWLSGGGCSVEGTHGHSLYLNPEKENGGKRTKRRKCKVCKSNKKSAYFCIHRDCLVKRGDNYYPDCFICKEGNCLEIHTKECVDAAD